MAETKDNVFVLGKEHIPDGGALIVPNFLSFHDLLVLEDQLTGRGITYLVEQGAVFDGLLQAHLEKDDVSALEFAVDDEHLETFREQIQANVSGGDLVIFIPGRASTRTGALTGVPSKTLSYLLKSETNTMPLFVDHPDETRLAIEQAGSRRKIVFCFGPLTEGAEANLAVYQENLHLAGQTAFEARPALDLHLAYALLLGLKKHASANHVYDGFQDKTTGFDKLLAAAIALSKHIKLQTQKERVGIVLPPGTGGLLANIAVLFAGKTPVNLNFTAGEAAVKSSIERAELDRFITADPFVRKTQNFPWPPTRQLIFLERTLPELKPKIILWLVASKILPAGILANMLGIPRKGNGREAVLLFTSGSSGDPKGVALTHRNVLANVNQFSSRLQLGSQDSALGCLPLFHSFGCTVTMWYPVIEGVNLVTYPTPLETPKLAQLIEEQKVSLLVATPTFLRGYLRRAKPEQLASLKLVVTGAEKLPSKVAEDFQKKFGKPVLEGYGLTETSPVTNVNLPDPEQDAGPVLPTHRQGSVGQLIPGISLRITDPETDEPLPLHETGMIWLSGPNVFGGYLNQPEKTEEMLHGTWLRTGDIGAWTRTASFTSRAGFRGFQRSPARWCRMKRWKNPSTGNWGSIPAATGKSPSSGFRMNPRARRW